MSRSAYEMILTLLPADGFEAQRDLGASTDFPPGESGSIHALNGLSYITGRRRTDVG